MWQERLNMYRGHWVSSYHNDGCIQDGLAREHLFPSYIVTVLWLVMSAEVRSSPVFVCLVTTLHYVGRDLSPRTKTNAGCLYTCYSVFSL